jgi:hypothetical protein
MKNVAETGLNLKFEMNIPAQFLEDARVDLAALTQKPHECDSCGGTVPAGTPYDEDRGYSCEKCLARDEQLRRFENFGYALADVVMLIPGRDRSVLLEIKDSIDCRLEQRSEALRQSCAVVDTTLELDRLTEQAEREFARKLAALLVGSFSSGLVNQLCSEVDHLVILAGQEVQS